MTEEEEEDPKEFCMRQPERFGPCQCACCDKLGVWRRLAVDDSDTWACYCEEHHTLVNAILDILSAP